MFGKLISLGSWAPLARTALIAFACLTLAPAAAVALALMVLLMSPVGLVAVPFMLSAFFGTANAEHREAVRRASLRPGLAPAYVHA